MEKTAPIYIGKGFEKTRDLAQPLFTYLHELFDPSTGLLTKS